MNLKSSLDWQALSKKVNERTLRERGIMLALTITLMVGVVDFLWLEPASRQVRGASGDIDTTRKQLSALEDQLMALDRQQNIDPDKQAREELAQLAAQQAELDRKIQTAAGQFVSPARMPEVLGALLREHPDLRVERVEALPVQALELAGSAQAVKLYSHGVKIVFRGSFVGLRDYLRDLEQLEQRLVWERLQFSLQTYPTGEVELVARTFSTGKEFISVYR